MLVRIRLPEESRVREAREPAVVLQRMKHVAQRLEDNRITLVRQKIFYEETQSAGEEL
jgi:hypothetical protein